MPSGYAVKIKLDPFLQKFLRGHFDQHNPVFEFPKGNDLLMRLEFYLSIPPRDMPAKSDPHPWDFYISIPHMDHKDPFYYNYISEVKNKMIQNRIREYFLTLFHEEIAIGRKKGFFKNEIIYQLMDEWGIPVDYEDRLFKEYQRYLKKERDQRFRKRSVLRSKNIKNRIS
jgi:hypothetical protein